MFLSKFRKDHPILFLTLILMLAAVAGAFVLGIVLIALYLLSRSEKKPKQIVFEYESKTINDIYTVYGTISEVDEFGNKTKIDDTIRTLTGVGTTVIKKADPRYVVQESNAYDDWSIKKDPSG